MQTPSHTPRSGPNPVNGTALSLSGKAAPGETADYPEPDIPDKELPDLSPNPVTPAERYRTVLRPLLRPGLLFQSPMKSRAEFRCAYWLAKLQGDFNRAEWANFQESLGMLEYLFKKQSNPGPVISCHYVSATILACKVELILGQLERAYAQLEQLTLDVDSAALFSREDREFARDIGRLYVQALKMLAGNNNSEQAELAREAIMDVEVWGLSNFSDDLRSA
ncbi:MAG: hypothetical protein ACR2PT_03290 [Endozoicomonas sp.]